MKQGNLLYFVPILAEAFRAGGTREAFQRAFERIEDLGCNEAYAEGYRQFLVFLQEVEARAGQEEPGRSGSPLDTMVSSTRETQVILEKDNAVCASVPVDTQSGGSSFANVGPGNYALRTGDGRLLWRGILSKTDVLWSEFRPQEPLLLAADSDSAIRQVPSREIVLFDGEAVLRVFPGLESACVVLKFLGGQQR